MMQKMKPRKALTDTLGRGLPVEDEAVAVLVGGLAENAVRPAVRRQLQACSTQLGFVCVSWEGGVLAQDAARPAVYAVSYRPAADFWCAVSWGPESAVVWRTHTFTARPRLPNKTTCSTAAHAPETNTCARVLAVPFAPALAPIDSAQPAPPPPPQHTWAQNALPATRHATATQHTHRAA